MLQKCIMSIQKLKFTELNLNKFGNKYDPVNLFLVDTYDYDDWFKNEKPTDTTRKSDKEESEMPPLEYDEEELKKEKRIKNFNSKQIIN